MPLEGVSSRNPEGKRYKKKGRDKVRPEGNVAMEVVLGQKRGGVDEEQEKAGKKSRVEGGKEKMEGSQYAQREESHEFTSAGLQEQPRREQ